MKNLIRALFIRTKKEATCKDIAVEKAVKIIQGVWKWKKNPKVSKKLKKPLGEFYELVEKSQKTKTAIPLHTVHYLVGYCFYEKGRPAFLGVLFGFFKDQIKRQRSYLSDTECHRFAESVAFNSVLPKIIEAWSEFNAKIVCRQEETSDLVTSEVEFPNVWHPVNEDFKLIFI